MIAGDAVMDFFQTFSTWLNGELASYIGQNTARVASILEPAVVTLATVYVMIWGYLQLTGRTEEPFAAGMKRIATLAVVFGVGLHLWLYNTLLVDTFYNAPTEFAAAVVGASDPIHTIDAIWNQGGAVADQLFRGGVGWGRIGFVISGVATWALVGLLCVYTMFLLALSSISLSILLALGPFFITLLLFDATRRFFDAWLAQLANYALITILTVTVRAIAATGCHLCATDRRAGQVDQDRRCAGHAARNRVGVPVPAANHAYRGRACRRSGVEQHGDGESDDRSAGEGGVDEPGGSGRWIMKTGALLIALLLLLGCASRPPRCNRRLTPINALFLTGTETRVGGS